MPIVIGRRNFITALSAAAASRSSVGGMVVATLWRSGNALAQSRMRRVGMMLPGAENDATQKARVAAFRETLAKLGWVEGRDIRFEYRWLSSAGTDLIKAHAAELVALSPDLILTGLTPVVQELLRNTRTIPIVFANIADPVGSGIVPSLANPGGNATGFTAHEQNIVGKWLELLKEIAPNITRVALVGNPDVTFSRAFRSRLETIAPLFAVQVSMAEVRNAADIARALDAFAAEPNGGVLVVPEFTPSLHRKLIFSKAAEHCLPAVYPFSFYAYDGGLASYGPDIVEEYRQAAVYVDRILRGEKPADLPVQAPTRYELVINLKTAKVLGLDVPAQLLGRADEVIE